MITKLTLRNLRANMGRFAMTTFGVVLAVSFVVSAFVLGDGLRATFGDLSQDIVASTDLEVRPIDTFGSVESLSDADLARVKEVDGVAMAAGLVEAPPNSVRPITAAGEEIPTTGPPQLAFNWIEADGFTVFELVEGAAPGLDQFIMDIDSAARHEFIVGDTYAVLTATGRHELTLSGLTRFGEDNSTLGATLMGMNTSQANELFGTTGYDSIAIALTDAARADLSVSQAAVAEAMPGLEVVNRTTLVDETAAEFNTQISVIQYILLGFAGISLLVSIFIIGNTFAIVLQQRRREMGLLRLIGADAGQLRRGALGEAAAIGLLASAIGIPGGIGVAAALTALFDAIGASLPAYDVIVSLRTIAVALGVGLGVTMVAAWWPTRSATRVPAMAALRDDSTDRTSNYRKRTIAGLLLGLVGTAVAALGVFGSGSTSATITMMALGAIAIFGAVTLISPRLVAPIAAGFGLVLDRLGMSGRLSVRNARRQSGRTATTASALMIGLAVVSMALVVGQSVKTQIGLNLDEAVSADYMLTDPVAAGFSSSVVEEVEANPIFGEVTGFRDAEMQVDGELVQVTAASLDAVPALFDLDVSDGGFGVDATDALVSRSRADADSLDVGSTIDGMLDNGEQVSLTITGIFDDTAVVIAELLVDVELFDQAGVTANETWIAFSIADGVDSATAAATVEEFGQRYPQGDLETAGEFRERLEGLIDQMLSVLNALVALAVVIALIGIANTLALSVSERTREIGLLRAVGMSRRGVRRMIRYESAVIAAFGAVLGVAMGIGLGWLTVQALPASFAGSLAIPIGQILVLVVVAAAAGLIAALLPARRAGRMNVLAAIAT